MDSRDASLKASDSTPRQRVVVTGDRVSFTAGMARPARRALSIAGDPELLTALGARLGPDPTVAAVWLRTLATDAGPLVAATRAFLLEGRLAAATTAAPAADVRSSAQLQALVLALDSAPSDPDAWMAGAGETPPFAQDAAPEINMKTERLLGRLRPGEPRPVMLTGVTSWFFWEGVGALYERIAEGWRPAISAAHGFGAPPRTVLIAGRSDGGAAGAEEMLEGDGGALAALGALGRPPGDDAAESGAAGDTLRRRLAQAEAAPGWPREALLAFLSDFDAPPPEPPQRPRARAAYLGAVVGVLDERAVDGAPAAPFALARAVGLAAFDVGAEMRSAWQALERSQPSLRGWAALLAARPPLREDRAALDAIDGFHGLARLDDLNAELAAAMSPGATTPLDSRAFAARLADLAALGAPALAQAPFALVRREPDGKWRAAGWTRSRAALFAELPRADQNRVADRLADIEHAALLGAGEPAPKSVWKAAVDSLRQGSGLDAQQQAPIQFARNFLDALADAVAGGAVSAALFWRRAFDSWVEQQAVREQFDLVTVLDRIAEKLPHRPGADAARRTAWLARERIAPQTTGAQRDPAGDGAAGAGLAAADELPPEPEGPRLSPEAAGMAALLGDRLAGAEEETTPEPAPRPIAARGGAAAAPGPDEARRVERMRQAVDDLADTAPSRPAEDAEPGDGAENDGAHDGGADDGAPRNIDARDSGLRDSGSRETRTDATFDDAQDDASDHDPDDAQEDAPRQTAEPQKRLGAGLARVRADIEQGLREDIEKGLGVERASEREVIRRRDPELLDIEDAVRSATIWRRSLGDELERRLSGEAPRPWSLTAAAGSAQEAVRQLRHLAEVVTELGKRAESRLPAEIVWAARQFGDLALDPKERPRPGPAPRGYRQAWAALAMEDPAEEPWVADIFPLALATEWLSLEPVDSRARPLVRLFEIALAGAAPQMVQLSGGRVAEVGPRTLKDYIYEPAGRDGFDAMDRAALIARLDRLIFFLSMLDWRVAFDPREKRSRLMRFWRPVPVADIVAPRERDRERQSRIEDSLATLDAPAGFVDRLGAEFRAGGEEARGYAQVYCSIVERTHMPQVGQLGRLYQLLRRDVLRER